MTTIFKTDTEQFEHFGSLIHARRSIFPSGKMTAVELGRASRQVTDSMGILDATIPGTRRVDAMISYAAKHGLAKPTYTLSNAGRRMNATISW